MIPFEPELESMIERIARSPLSVILQGETGTGKDVAARKIHQLSARNMHPFVPVNCGALTESLLESELFGHEKGSFTGADRARIGLLESADQGTVFLDEIGDMPMSLQVKLLRVLEQSEIMRVGSSHARPIDARVICATHQDLPALIAQKRFRADLYFRLNGITITIPALRERGREFIEALVREFAHEAGEKLHLIPVIEPSMMLSLCNQPWPGNIRELRHTVTRLILLAKEGNDAVILPAPTKSSPLAEDALPHMNLHEMRRNLERRKIIEALALHGGNQTRTALFLGISRGTLATRLILFNIPRPKR